MSCPIDRRTFLHCATAAAAVLACPIARAQNAAAVSVSIAYEAAGIEIAPDFVGLSYESSILVGEDLSPENGSVLARRRRRPRRPGT
jgi:hypothetical protein